MSSPHPASRSLPSSFEPLSDGVVVLRRFAEGDTPALIACLKDPEIPRWTRVPTPYRERDAREWVAHQEQAWQTGEEARFAIVTARGPPDPLADGHRPGCRRAAGSSIEAVDQALRA